MHSRCLQMLPRESRRWRQYAHVGIPIKFPYSRDTFAAARAQAFSANNSYLRRRSASGADGTDIRFCAVFSPSPKLGATNLAAALSLLAPLRSSALTAERTRNPVQPAGLPPAPLRPVRSAGVSI